MSKARDRTDHEEKYSRNDSAVNTRRVTVCIIFSVILVLTHAFFPLGLQSEMRHHHKMPNRLLLTNHSLLLDNCDKNQTYKLDESFMYGLKKDQIKLSAILFANLNKSNQRAHLMNHADVMCRNIALLNHHKSNLESFQTFNSLSLACTALAHLNQLKYPSLLIAEYTRVVHSWSKYTSAEMMKTYTGSGRGIVITTGDSHAPFALVLLDSLRNVLNCTLPIQIAHAGPDDLSSAYLNRLLRFKDVSAFDMREFMHPGVQGWYMKPFAILFSSFKEVMLIDADVLFMVRPESLFLQKNYVDTGFLIYRDRRVKILRDVHKQLVEVLGEVSDTLRASGLYNDETNQEAESGVVLYDKGRPGILDALTTTCSMNWKSMLPVVDTYFHGEKETFWLGFELIGVPYQFVDAYGATVGEKASESAVCGALSHCSDEGELIFFNGGLAVSKSIENINNILKFDHFTIDDKRDVSGEWTWSADYSLFCWESNSPYTQVKALSTDQKQMIEMFIETYKKSISGEYYEL